MTEEGARILGADLLLTLAIGALFLALFAIHRWDLRRRRRRVAAIRSAREFGPNRGPVEGVISAAGSLDAALATSLAAERRRAFDWDPRLDRPPKEARAARDHAYANERDDVARAAAEAARDAAAAALAGTTLAEPVRDEALDCVAETAGAIVAVERLPAPEFRMLTRAWRTVVGPLGVAPRREP